MTTGNRAGSRAGNRTRGNNGKGANRQTSRQSTGFLASPRASTLTKAAAVGSAVAAGIFLWSRRNQISDQLEILADQISDWREGIGSGSDEGSQVTASDDGSHAATASSGSRSQVEIAQEALSVKELGNARA